MPATPDAPPARRAVVALALLAGLAAPAWAQLGGSVSVQSDARFRGVSISGGKPQAQANLVYDGPQGWYGGAMLTRMRFDEYRQSPLLLGYLGRVFALAPGLDAEAGATYTRFTSASLGVGYDYAEAYAGLIADRWHGRLYYSNNYFDRQQRSLYLELGGNVPLGGAVQAFGQVGVLDELSGPNRPAHGSTRLDLRTGAAWRQGAFEFSLAWVAVSRGGPYAASYAPSYSAPRKTWILGGLWAF